MSSDPPIDNGPDSVDEMAAMLVELDRKVTNLKRALTDCMSYVECDNLTMQYKHRNWERVLDDGDWVSGNVQVTGE